MIEDILIKQDSAHNSTRELSLFKRFLVLSIFLHIVFLTFDPSHFFFAPKTLTEEGSIDIDLIALDSPHSREEEPTPQPLLLPQVPKKFELEIPKKPDEMVLDEKKEPIKEEPKVTIEQKKEEDLTKVSLDRLLKELNRDKAKEKQATKILSHSLKERKKELEKGLLHGFLSLGNTEAGYDAVVKTWIQKNYALPEIYELKNADIKAVVQLVLNSEGGIAKLSLKHSSQNTLFDQLAMKTVENAAPFPTPPRDWVGRTIILPFEPKALGQ
jgi:TonB family protein